MNENTPAAYLLLNAIHGVQQAINDLEEEHGEDCDCSICWDAQVFRWAVDIAESLVYGELPPLPRPSNAPPPEMVAERPQAQPPAKPLGTRAAPSPGNPFLTGRKRDW